VCSAELYGCASSWLLPTVARRLRSATPIILTSSGFQRAWMHSPDRTKKIAADAQIFPMAIQDHTQLFQRGARSESVTRTEYFTFTLGVRSNSLKCSNFCSKLRASHRGTSLGPFVCEASKWELAQFTVSSKILWRILPLVNLQLPLSNPHTARFRGATQNPRGGAPLKENI
jgi:hypothetical protein